MNIHEYQAKALFEEFSIPSPKGAEAQSVEGFAAAVAKLSSGALVVKSQIHAGGRGKGTFTDGYQGGVKVCHSREEALEAAGRMLGNTLVTKQTGEAGRLVKTVYFAEPVDIAHEYYLAILLDRAVSKPVIIASTEGGVDIEEVAEHSPEKILRVHVDPVAGLQPYQKRRLAFGLGLSGKQQLAQFDQLITGLFRLFTERDCSMVEVNPMVKTPAGDILALDAKVNFDENALYRQPKVAALRDKDEEDPREVEASQWGLNYIALEGNIACLVNGAGLAMATMDIIKHFGGSPANFLDVGGGANAEQVENAFRIILSDPAVKGILVNIFGGIMSCKTIATGILAAAKKVNLNVPLVVRLEGSESAEGKALLASSTLDIIAADSLADGARKIVAAVG